MAFTKAQLEALKNSLLASNQPILASQHRQQVQSIIDEMYDAQSRANILVGVQSDTVQGGSDTFLVFRSGQAFQLPVSLLNANDLANLGDVFINNLEDGDSLVYDAVADRWENRSILLGFALSNLTDVELTSLAGGDILRYDSGDDLWKNVSLASLLAPYVTLDTAQTITGAKTFSGDALRLAIAGTAKQTILRNSTGDVGIFSDSNVLGFNSNNNLYLTSAGKGGVIFNFNNSTSNRTYTLQNLDGTLAFLTDISDATSNLVTTNTTQTITGAKTFNSLKLNAALGGIPTILTNSIGGVFSDQTNNYIGFTSNGRFYFSTPFEKVASFNPENLTATRTYTLQDASGTLAFLSDIPTIPADNVTGTGTAGQVSFWTGANTQGGDSGFVWDNGNKRATIASPNFTINTFGNLNLQQSDLGGINKGTSLVFRNNVRTTSGSNIDFNAQIAALKENDINDNSRTYLAFYTSGAGQFERWRIDSNGILQSNGAQTIQTSTGNLTLATAAGNGNIILSPHGTGNVGIGTSSPSSKLEIAYSINTTTATPHIVLSTGGTVKQAAITAESSNISGLVFSTGDGNLVNRMTILRANGNVGIGTTSPGSKLSIVGLPTSSSGLSAGDVFNDNGTLKIV
jgi:hypothetical protein